MNFTVISPFSRARRNERGAALLLALVVLVVLLASGVAVMRSMNSSLAGAGNLAFRRDLVNQAEQAIAKAVKVSYPASASKDNNYSTVPLAANAQGIPLALLDDTQFAAVGKTTNDLTGATNDVKIRYVVERLCINDTQTAELQGKEGCATPLSNPAGGSAQLRPGGSTGLAYVTEPIYRVSARVLGPRNTRVFIQSTFTKPETD
ncbi:hypothetical protein [Variovorax paradoxus]|jgi:Tfp pilus assembly protein PilX|uniref:hypothetical protein n=1 Tax=Variovorax paradoxus TaxID=34073 RepID=UPI003398AC1D